MMNVDNSMPMSMEDLVAALSSSAHIGQEALDIQALHNQLAQTLHMTPSFPTPVGTSGRPRTCTTPIASSSSAFSSISAIPISASSSYSRPRVYSADADIPMHEDFEDELAVEHMLASPRTPVMDLASDPMSSISSRTNGGYVHPHQHMSMSSFAPVSPESSFAREDPFFRSVTLQHSTSTMQAPSFFAQAARPSQSSPFFNSQGSQGGFAGAASPASGPTMASFAPAQVYAHMSPFGA